MRKTAVDGIHSMGCGVGDVTNSQREIQKNCASVTNQTIEVAPRSADVMMMRSKGERLCQKE